MITIEDAARRPEWVAPISIPIDITAVRAIAEALACVGNAMAWDPPRCVAAAWVWIDVAQRVTPGHGQCRTVVTHDATECYHHVTPETWDPLEGAMLDLLWAHSAARRRQPGGDLRTCEGLHAARCSLRTWWEMPR